MRYGWLMGLVLLGSPAAAQRIEMSQITDDRLSVPLMGMIVAIAPPCGVRSQAWADRLRDEAVAGFGRVSILREGERPSDQERAAWLGAFAMADRMGRMQIQLGRSVCGLLRQPGALDLADMVAGPDPGRRPASPQPSRRN